MTNTEYSDRVRIDDAPDGSATTVRLLDSFLNYTFADTLKAQLKEACRIRIEQGVRGIVVDLSAVSVMDSCGLSVLIGLRKLVDERQGRLVLCGASPIIQRLLVITRLDRVFDVRATEAEARAALLKLDAAPAA